MKDLAERAVKTFAEAFLSSVVANLTLFTDALGDYGKLKSVAIAVGVGAFAAAISVTASPEASGMEKYPGLNKSVLSGKP